MAHNGLSSLTSTTTTTILEEEQEPLPTELKEVRNDSLNSNRLSQDSAVDLDGDLQMDMNCGDEFRGGCLSTEELSGVSSGDVGVDGDVNSIFLCEFHPVAGPQITLQVPNDYVTKDLFRIVHQYIIPKVPLQGSFLSM